MNWLFALGKKIYAPFRSNEFLRALMFKLGWCTYVSAVETARSGFSKIFLARPESFLDSKNPNTRLFIADLGKRIGLELVFPDASLMLLTEEIIVEEAYTKVPLSEGDVVVDVGANMGVFSVYASKLVGKSGKVVCVEPEKGNLRFLKKNLERNRCANAVIIKKGVWSKKTKLKLWLLDGNIAAHSVVIKRSKRFVEIPVDALDNLVKNLKRIDLIKVDIEGAEVEAVKGMTRTLKQKGLNLAIAAYHTLPNGKLACEVIVPYLKRRGLKAEEDERTHFIYSKR